MAKSSINFAKASGGGVKHNDRTEEKEPDYLLPIEHRGENEVDFSAIEAEQKIKDLYSAAKENYQDKFGQKLQAKSYTWESVINLNKEHNLDDVQRLVKAIEKETGFTSVQIAIHRDEGHINERGIVERNLHAHVTFFTLDKNTGQQLYRKAMTPKQKEQQPDIKPMTRARLSELQTLTADTLKMERGKKGSTAQRRTAKQERAYNQEKAIEAAKIKDLKAEVAEVKLQLNTAGAGREDYAELEQLNRDLKIKIKNKDLTITELKDKIQTLSLYSNHILEKNKDLEAKINDLDDLDVQVVEKPDKNDLKAISDVLDHTNEADESDKNILLQNISEFEKGDLSKDFIDLVQEKGDHKEKTILNKRYTVTFDMEDLNSFLKKLQDSQEIKVRLFQKAKDLLNKFEKPLKAIKSYVHEHFTTPKAKEQMRERQKELEQKKHQKELLKNSKHKTDKGFGL